jgi:hypothetical protein
MRLIQYGLLGMEITEAIANPATYTSKYGKYGK